MSSEKQEYPGSFYVLADKNAHEASAVLSISSWSWKELEDPGLWRAALVEMIGSASLTFVTAIFALGNARQATGIANPIFIGIFSWFTLALHIMACAPTSGGHLNSAITIATFACRLTTPCRLVLYVASQLTGAIIGGALVRAAAGTELSDQFSNAACVYNEELVSRGSAFVVECGGLFVVIFLAFGTALDPRQRKITGPLLGPILTGLGLGLAITSTGTLRQGYPGAGMNPSRCFGLAVPVAAFSSTWIHWSATFVVSAVIGLLYHLAPPRTRDA